VAMALPSVSKAQELAPVSLAPTFLSLALPGAGQHVLGQKRKWAYAALEVVGWAVFLERRSAGNDYRGAGIGLRDDERRDLFRRAAEGGHPDAQDTYAGMVKKEHPEEALAWYRKAAEQGHPHAYAGIGGCLMDQVKTEGGGTNITALRQALDAYKKAALLGDYQAQHFLALAHLARGTYDEAYAWAKIGSTSRNSWPAHGPIIEKLYKDLAKSLKDVLKKCRGYTSPEQEREGKRLAKEYEKEIRANLKKGLPWEEPED